jgi:replicative DNA helicase
MPSKDDSPQIRGSHMLAARWSAKEKAIARKLISNATQLIEGIYEGKKELTELLDENQENMRECANQLAGSLSSVSDHWRYYGYSVKRLFDLHELKIGISTGYSDLDELTAGFHRGNLVIISGWPSMGKTALAHNFARHATDNSDITLNVLLFSPELRSEEVTLRILSAVASTDFNFICHINEEGFQKITKSSARFEKMRIFIDDTPDISIHDLRMRARHYEACREIDMILVDSLQLIRGPSNTQTRQQEFTEISRSLRALAREQNLPVILVAQLEPAKEQSNIHRRPIINDLRQYGNIEEFADLILFVHREELFNKADPELQGKAEIIIAKNANGPPGKVMLTFKEDCFRFDNLKRQGRYVGHGKVDQT